MEKWSILMCLLKNIDCGYAEAVLTSTHNLCFGTKIDMSLQSPVFLYIKVGFKCIYILRNCLPDDKIYQIII